MKLIIPSDYPFKWFRIGSLVVLPKALYGTPRVVRIVKVEQHRFCQSGVLVTGIAISKSRGNGKEVAVDSGWIR
jgi:hypothetical protein